MGVDSGLPDFRGDEGFWKAYPLYRQLGLSFVQAANPAHFERDPAFGWGFYGHRLNLYRQTTPHRGYHLVRHWAAAQHWPLFAVSSNVDGQLQQAGFVEDQILEVHGSIHHLQCLRPCSDRIWPNGEQVQVDPVTLRADRYPLCPQCGGPARPNILMFNDHSWIEARTRSQADDFQNFLNRNRGTALCIIEVGAGTAVPTIRALGEDLARHCHATLVRINPRQPEGPPGTLSLPMNGLEGLEALGRWLNLSTPPVHIPRKT